MLEVMLAVAMTRSAYHVPWWWNGAAALRSENQRFTVSAAVGQGMATAPGDPLLGPGFQLSAGYFVDTSTGFPLPEDDAQKPVLMLIVGDQA